MKRRYNSGRGSIRPETGRLCRALDGLPGDARDLLEALAENRKEAKPT